MYAEQTKYLISIKFKANMMRLFYPILRSCIFPRGRCLS